MAAETDRPDILLITCDQWRADLGERFGARLPHLDALAAAGTRFMRHYTQALPCGPARASLLTGLYAHKHRSITNGTPLDGRHPTVFTEARRAGYRPVLFGYTDTTLDPRGKPAADPDNGEYENVCPGLAVETLLTGRASPWIAHLLARGYRIEDADGGRLGVFGQRGFGEPALFAAGDSEAAFLTDRFLQWLGAAGSGPLFAHLSYIAPHPPFAAAAPWHASVDPAVQAAPIGDEGPAHPYLAARRQAIRLENYVPGWRGDIGRVGGDDIARVRAIYAGMAEAVDHQLGRVFAALRETGRWARTLIVFTSDHGEQAFDHGLLGKADYFDASAHVPLIIRDPAEAGGHVVTAFTEAIDLMPTILAAAGLEAPRNADGRSLLGFCGGSRPGEWRDAAHWAFDFRDIATRGMERRLGLASSQCNLQVVRTERLKYVAFAGLAPVLFDLAADPEETRDISGESGARALLLEGMERMLRWRQDHEDETLTGFLARDGVLYNEARDTDGMRADGRRVDGREVDSRGVDGRRADGTRFAKSTTELGGIT